MAEDGPPARLGLAGRVAAIAPPVLKVTQLPDASALLAVAFNDNPQLTVVRADTEAAFLAGELHAQSQWAGLLLPNAMCLATPVPLEASVITADRAWARLDVGVLIDVIR